MIFTSIEMAGRLPQTWRPRLRVILDCWALLTDQQKERLRSHIATVWRQSSGDRRLFGYVTHSAADHAILTWFLRDVPGAPQELAAIIQRVSKEEPPVQTAALPLACGRRGRSAGQGVPSSWRRGSRAGWS